ncbi:hypothetical protein [Dyadobacter aurulentus]|uniref:hypothetical protein n=1 Tax=Dyadobacter sp. UC 10 TaxID=2605428 RepID=UPI0011F0A455|nr:hypothetical protein [Dyadobacter sp. UC 10]KAA0989805.1 hypothetical protein FXO21_06310 [Dyadobacter sp. UC 10]
MWQQPLILLVLLSPPALSQPFYTPIRAAIGAELGGVSPQFSVTASVATAYKKRSFVAIQAGLGWLDRAGFKSPSFSAAGTYCFLLNPYNKKACTPQPGYNSLEIYLEGGLAALLLDPYDNNRFVNDDLQHQFATPLALGGVRFHLVSRKWIYILKIRFTPALVKSKYTSSAGLGVGIGWR